MSETNITREHEEAFEAAVAGVFAGRTGLLSCFLDGRPTVAIVNVAMEPDGDARITPLFVYVTDELAGRITDHDGQSPRSDAERSAMLC